MAYPTPHPTPPTHPPTHSTHTPVVGDGGTSEQLRLSHPVDLHPHGHWVAGLCDLVEAGLEEVDADGGCDTNDARVQLRGGERGASRVGVGRGVVVRERGVRGVL